MTAALTDREAERAMSWADRTRPDLPDEIRARGNTPVRYRYRPGLVDAIVTPLGEIDPDDEPYGDLGAYRHPRPARRWPVWKVALRLAYLKVSTR